MKAGYELLNKTFHPNDPAPGYLPGSNGKTRVLLVMGRLSFRGYAGFAWMGHGEMHLNKDLLMCTAEAARIQRAVVLAIVRHFIEPLERAGVEVDVVIHTQDCDEYVEQYSHTSFASKEAEMKELQSVLENRTFKQSLIDWFGHKPQVLDLSREIVQPKNVSVANATRVIKSRFITMSEAQPHNAKGETQSFQSKVGTALAEDLFREGLFYRSIMNWRFDVPPIDDFVDPKDDLKTFLATGDWPVGLKKKDTEYTHRDFLLKSGESPLHFEDQLWSYPGWMLPCVVAHCANKSLPPYPWKRPTPCENEPMLIELVKIAWSNRTVLSQFRAPDHYGKTDWWTTIFASIYRGPYSWNVDTLNQAKWFCRYLNKYFDGPECSSLRVATEVCFTIKWRQQDSVAYLNQTMSAFAERLDNKTAEYAFTGSPFRCDLYHGLMINCTEIKRANMALHNISDPGPPNESVSIVKTLDQFAKFNDTDLCDYLKSITKNVQQKPKIAY